MNSAPERTFQTHHYANHIPQFTLNTRKRVVARVNLTYLAITTVEYWMSKMSTASVQASSSGLGCPRTFHNRPANR
jgi:hypothetical protein